VLHYKAHTKNGRSECKMWELAVSIVIVGLFMIMINIAFKLSDEHEPIKLLFFLMSLIIMIAGAGYAVNLAETYGTVNQQTVMQTSYAVVLWPLIFVIFWFMLYFFMHIVMWWRTRADLQKEMD